MEHLFKTLKSLLIPVHPSGWRYIAACAVGGLLTGWLISDFVGLVLLLGAVFLAFFFRDPQRVSPQREGLVLAPVDGTLGDSTNDGEAKCLTIDTSPLNVQIARSPVTGTIAKITTDTDSQKADITFTATSGDEITLHLSLCRNVGVFTPTVFEGDDVKAGQKLGVARAVTSVHLHHSMQTTPLTLTGQRTLGGETVLLDAKSHEPLRESIIS